MTIMNRRSIIKLGAVAPLVGLSPSVREIRRDLLISGSIPVQIIVSAHTTSRFAESFRRGWIEGGPFESEGEFYVDSSETRELPEELSTLPGTLLHYRATVGVAAARETHLVGSFRRETVAYIVRMRGTNEAIMLDIARHFAAQPLPGPFEARWNATHLEALIPDSDDLQTDVRPEKGFWP